MDTLKNILLILAVVLSFNVMIFVHELGHFLAARWRGLKIEKFQVWFGKPIWSKTINGVQYGLGWIPAGGFVALPQLAPMDTIEGRSESDEPLPPISPLDKIIVAVAGPIFSLGLAVAIGLAVWGLGKPLDLVPTTQVGYIFKDSPAEAAGFQLGDTILAVNGNSVIGFAGSLDCITENIVLSRGKDINFTVKREGINEPIIIKSSFKIESTPIYQRRALRHVGIMESFPAKVKSCLPNSPAEKAGIKPGDVIDAVDGIKVWSSPHVSQILESKKFQTFSAKIRRGQSTINLSIEPIKPLTPKDSNPMIGISWDMDGRIDRQIVYPNPIKQCKDSIKQMVATIIALTSRDSSVGIDQLSGPIGIATTKYKLLETDHDGWRRLLAFLVLINVNLAIFNMLPLPVLDGGHTTLAIMEWIARRPVKARILEYIQSAFALVLISLFLYITTKDVGGFLGPKEKQEPVTFSH